MGPGGHGPRKDHWKELSGSLLGVGLWVLGADLQAVLIARANPRRFRRKDASNPMWNSYRAGDGKWFILVNPGPDPYWPRVCAALRMPELADDPSYVTPEGLAANAAEVIDRFDEIFATKSREEWGKILDANGVIWAPVQDLTDVMSDPQVRVNDYLTTLEHPSYGPYQTVDTPIRFGDSEVRARGPAPEIGQLTEEVLLENGYAWEDVTALRDAGVI